MNRLTEWTGEGWIAKQEKVNGKRIGDKDIYAKLAAYENTGLEPEQIKQLNDAFTNVQKKLAKAFDDLLEYKDLEEQGLLIKLPCKVGDTVYINIQKKTYECKISGFYIIEDEIQFMIAFPDEDNATWFVVGETYKQEDLFLTREEAEKALEDK